MELRVLELFSGIGGMHYAFKYAQLPGCVVAAMDINTVANIVYAHNHPKVPVLNNNIQKLQAETLEKLRVNMLLMSPPCQPHTRIGHKRDVDDNRSDALNHLCALLPECSGLQYVLMENVKGFEGSKARSYFVDALESTGFQWREFILSPTQFGVPNTRHRYYCIARRNGSDFSFKSGIIWQRWPKNVENTETSSIEGLLEAETSILVDTYLSEKVLNKRVWSLDIATVNATNTMCFTKAYTRYSEGTGSIYTPLPRADVETIFAQLKRNEQEEFNMQRMAILKSLSLRYFTPREVARLMSFPETFDFPKETTHKQMYRLLGNSINVRVVGELIKLMCET